MLFKMNCRQIIYNIINNTPPHPSKKSSSKIAYSLINSKKFIDINNNKKNSTKIKMIRNKTPLLIQQKHKKRPHNHRPQPQPLQTQPWWFQQYYINKQQLTIINSNNKNIANMIMHYQVNPTVYARTNIQKIITDNCQKIEQVEGWLRNFKYGYGASGNSQRAMTSYFQTTLSQQILSLFNNKQQLASIGNEISHSRSFLNTSQPNALNISTQHHYQQDRNRSFNEINNRIQNLNVVLRRMNAVVVGQGDLINRIDQNLQQGKVNMGLANQQLGRRVQRQHGEGQFTCQGKVNKVITGLYIVNLIILVMFLLKHLIF